MLLSKKTTVFLIVLLILGIFFRFVNLDQKIYWGDESLTSLRIAGYSSQEFRQEVLRKQPISARDLQKYQYPPQSDTNNVLAIVHDWAKDSVEYHPPLYFIILRFWVQWFGNSITVIRSFSAVISLLALPGIYWLCQELFNFPPTSWMAMVLLAVSPLQILYAQEARNYSMLTLAILWSSAVFLWAYRTQKKISWCLYAFTVIWGIYSHYFFVLVVISHGIYLIFIDGFRFTKKLIYYLISLGIGGILFLPWLFLYKFYFRENPTKWADEVVSHVVLFKTWILNLSLIFFDFNDTFRFRYLLGYIFVTLLSIYAFYYLSKNTQKSAWIFIFSLVGVTGLVLAIPDLVFGGIRSLNPRYLLATYLGIQIAIAHLLATKIFVFSGKKWRRFSWSIVTLILISLGVFSCATLAQTKSSWNKYLDIHYDQVAEIVNRYDNPLVVAHWFRLPSLSHILNPEIKVYSSSLENAQDVTDKFCDIFVYNYRGVMKKWPAKHSQYQLEKIYNWHREIAPNDINKATLWHIKNVNCKLNAIKLQSTAFSPDGLIPAKYACDGQDISPPLSWDDPPAGTKSLTLIGDDPDAPGKTWVHWVVYNLPPDTRSLPENLPAGNSLPSGGLQGITDFRRVGYGGPCPPSGTHRYFFKLYALDVVLDLKPGATKSQVEAAMKGHILAQGGLMGRYHRR